MLSVEDKYLIICYYSSYQDANTIRLIIWSETELSHKFAPKFSTNTFFQVFAHVQIQCNVTINVEQLFPMSNGDRP